MTNTIVYNGVEYTEDEVKKLIIEKVKEVWSKIKSFVKKAYEYLLSIANYLSNQVGYKRLNKQDYLIKCESMSECKSNNWRKVHGLHLIRQRV